MVGPSPYCEWSEVTTWAPSLIGPSVYSEWSPSTTTWSPPPFVPGPSDYTSWIEAETSSVVSFMFYDNGTEWVDVSDQIYFDTGTSFVGV